MFRRWLNTLSCKFNGHSPKIIEKYNDTITIRNYQFFGNKLVLVPPFESHKIYCKWKCKQCGVVSIGNLTYMGKFIKV